MYELDVISDNSKKNLTKVPDTIMQMRNLKMLYLEGNFIDLLPDDFFPQLQQLSWLDLRNNRLQSIPGTIAHHPCLENLLLTNNQIRAIPNELGLVPKLKVLQISNNPLAYPSTQVLKRGLRALSAYLRAEYGKANAVQQDADADNEETELLVIEKAVSNSSNGSKKDNDNVVVDESAAVNPRELSMMLQPVIVVKKLSSPQTTSISSAAGREDGDEIVHHIVRRPSKISLKSYYSNNERQKVKPIDGIEAAQLKENWLNKLKVLLAEQEKILQQERNLRTLSSWRLDKKQEPMRTSDAARIIVDPPPYDTDPQYDTMPSRKDLSEEVAKLARTSGATPPKQIDIEKLIGEVSGQLKQAQTNFDAMRSPRGEIEEAGKQINAIMDIHRKLQLLQASNDSFLG